MKISVRLFALLLCLLALSLSLGSCGSPATPDVSEHLTLDREAFLDLEVDFGAFLEKKMDARYQDCHDLPHYLREYKTELFWSIVLPKASLDYGQIDSVIQNKKAEWIRPAENAYAQYRAANGDAAVYKDLESFAEAYYGLGAAYASLDEYASSKARAAVLRLAILYRVVGEVGELPTAEEMETAYNERIDDLLADTNKSLAAEGGKLYTREEMIATLENNYGAAYLRDDVTYGLLMERVLTYIDKAWTLTVPELTEEDTPAIDKTEIDPSLFEDTEEVTTLVRLHISSLSDALEGDVYIRLYPNVAPRTVKNFQDLVSEGFYDGLIFHRVVENFCVQGGGFNKSGVQMPADRIPAEFFAAGGKNHLLHRTGVVSMARATDYNSATSQFFFTMSDNYTQALDGKYAAFGFVVAGWDLVEELSRVETGQNDKPTATYFIEKATFVTEKN